MTENGTEFVYVFSEENKELLLKKGFVLLKDGAKDANGNIVYVFKNDPDIYVNFKKFDCVLANFLTF